MENATVFVVTGKLLLLVEIVSFWGLFSKKKTKKKKKKKHISKMTWQLIAETNWGG